MDFIQFRSDPFFNFFGNYKKKFTVRLIFFRIFAVHKISGVCFCAIRGRCRRALSKQYYRNRKGNYSAPEKEAGKKHFEPRAQIFPTDKNNGAPQKSLSWSFLSGALDKLHRKWASIRNLLILFQYTAEFPDFLNLLRRRKLGPVTN